jgi:hypothetical protein
MALPTGSGSEILKRITVTGDFNTAQTAFTVPALHIYTVLTIIATEQGSASELLTFRMTDADNSNREIFLLQNQALGSLETFIYSDRFVLYPGDMFKINAGSSCNIDVLISLIDQNWED